MTSLGSRYASALLSIALDEGKNSEYRDYAKVLIEVLDKDEKKKVIDNVFKNCPYDSIKNLFKVVIDNNRARYIKEILTDFVTLSNSKDNISEGFIISAQELSKDQILEVSNAISKKLNKKIYLKPRIDENLIGGFKVVINDYVFDATLKNKIEELKNSLMERR